MRILITLVIAPLILVSCSAKSTADNNSSAQATAKITANLQGLDTATLAGGCFWCVEAALEQIKGVREVVSGYSGGKAENADYRKVASGRTGHAEAVQVYFDPEIINYETLLQIFFTAHDPTQLNRQGPDVGPQYRSEIFYHDEEQKRVAEATMKELNPKYNGSIVTKLSRLDAFYTAEDYHQDYQKKNPYQPYIVSVSKPKAKKVREKFPDLIKED